VKPSRRSTLLEVQARRLFVVDTTRMGEDGHSDRNSSGIEREATPDPREVHGTVSR
jgi:hypothetical protein